MTCYKLTCDNLCTNYILARVVFSNMYPNQNVNLSQFYPGQSYSTRTAYPYPFYIQTSHHMNVASAPPTQKNTAVTYHDAIFTDTPSVSSLPTSQTRFQGKKINALLN